MTTPILKITEAANGQVDQYLTYNEALRALESSTNNFYVVDMSSGDVTLTDAANVNPALNYIFSRNQVFRTIGNTVARVLTVPQTKRLFVVQNAGTFALTVKRGTSEISLAATLASIFYCDGTANGLVAIGSTGNYVAGPASSADNEIALFDGASGKSLKRGPVVGTAASANVVTSNTDTTAGRATNVGWMGAGARSISIDAGGTLSTNQVSGFYNYTNHDLPISTDVGGITVQILATTDYTVSFLGRNGRFFGVTRENGNQTDCEFWTDANLVKTTSAIDTTTGRLPVSGWLGNGRTLAYKSQATDDLNDFNVAGAHGLWGGSSLNRPTNNVYIVHVLGGSPSSSEGQIPSRLVQVAYQVGGTASYRRSYNGSSWSSWTEEWNTGNTSSDVQTMLSAANNAAIRSAISASSLPPYTLGTVPSAAANTNLLIVITDLTGGREPCYSDGDNWLRCSDKTIAS